MTLVISVVGSSGSGKTRLIDMLIPELKMRGIKAGVIKHAVHGVDIALNGKKDSDRHFSAGATVSLVGNDNIVELKINSSLSLEKLEKYILLLSLLGCNIVFIEGFKKYFSPFVPKIVTLKTGEVFEKNSVHGPILAFVSEEKRDDIKPLFTFNDIQDLLKLVLEKYNKTHEKEYPYMVKLNVNGTDIPFYKKFVSDLVANTIEGLVKTLHKVEDPSEIILYIRKNIER